MEKLPPDCIRTIAAKLAECDDKYRRMCDAAVDAASLLLVGNSAFTDLSIAVQEKLEPSGRARTAAEYDKMRLPGDLTDASTADKLKEACRVRGLQVSGVKAALWGRLRDAVEAVRPPRGCILSSKFRTETTAKRRARVCASTAKSDYLLTDGDLAALPCELVRNPVYRSAAPMRLYLVRDLIRAALAKHGGRDAEIRRARASASARGGEAAMERRASREALLARKLGVPILAELSHVFSFSEAACRARDTYVGSGRGGAAGAAAEIMAAHDRINTLEQALAARGCELRHDSRLCRAFIDHDDGDPEDIAITMEEMKFYFAHTDYDSILDELWEDARDERNDYDSDDGYRERIDPDELSACAKSEALKRWAETHDHDAPELPSSLRATVCQSKARSIMTSHMDAWRARQPPIPHDIRNEIEQVFRQIVTRTRDTAALTAVSSTLQNAEAAMSARVEAVFDACKRIRAWGPGTDNMFRTEAQVLNATEEGYNAIMEARRIQAEKQRAALKEERRIQEERRRQSKIMRRQNVRQNGKAACPVCNRIFSSEQGVRDHAWGAHKLSLS
jgi:hypothetical protein